MIGLVYFHSTGAKQPLALLKRGKQNQAQLPHPSFPEVTKLNSSTGETTSEPAATKILRKHQKKNQFLLCSCPHHHWALMADEFLISRYKYH